MNGKKAKALRRLAQEKTIGQPKYQIGWMEIVTTVFGVRRKHYEMRLMPCTKKEYKKLKKEAA